MKSEQKGAIALFIVMMLLYASSYFQRTAVPGTVFTELQKEGLSATQISGLTASYVYIYAVMQLPVGMLVDRYGGLRCITAGGIFLGLGTLFFPVFSNYYLSCICRFLAGLGSSFMYLSLVKETDRMFGRTNYASMIGIVYFVGYGGGLLGTLPFATLNTLFPWRKVLLGAGVLTVGVYMLFLFLAHKRELPTVQKNQISLRPVCEIITNRDSFKTIYCSVMNFAVYFVIQTVFGKKFLEDVAGMGSVAASSVIFALTLVCMLLLFFIGRISKRMGNRRCPIMRTASLLSFFVTLTMLLMLIFHGNAWAFSACYLIYAAISGCTVIYSAAIQEMNPREYISLTTGIGNMACYLFVAVFSQIVGKILDFFGTVAPGSHIYPMKAYITVFVLLLCFSGISAFFIFRVPETKGQFIKQKSDVPVS